MNKTTDMLKGLVICCFAALFPAVWTKADSTFVECGIMYRLITEDSVNIVAREGGYPAGTFKDSALCVPARVSHEGRTYHVRSIGREAFAKCSAIKHVVICEGIEEIHDYAFALCANMESISIPSSVRDIGEYSLSFCVSLTSISVDEANETFDSRDGCNAIIRTKGDRLLAACKGTRIPSSVDRIDGSAYKGCLIDSVIIPDGVRQICEYAFSYCPRLTRVHISSTVEMIDEGMFYECPNITSITVDERNKDYDSRGGCNAIISGECLVRGCSTTIIPAGVEVIGRAAFYQCTGLRSIVIPEGVTDIQSSAFSDCSSLKHVSLPSTLTYLEPWGGRQFHGCTSLDSIYIPANVDTLNSNAFSCCTSLCSIVVDPKNKKFDSRDGCNAIIETSEDRLMVGCNSTVIPEGVWLISNEAFAGSGITSINIPASVTSIDSMVFFRCDRLMSITVAPDNKTYKSDGSNSIVERKTGRLVLGCATTRFLPEVTSIGAYAFAGTPEVLVLPEGIRDIGICAFFWCRDLRSVVIPRSVKHVGRGAFYGCSRLFGKVFMGDDVKID